MQVVKNVKVPLKTGELYLVPCITSKHEDGRLYITPVIDHPHSDKENGQVEDHYHVDYRFVKHKADGDFPTVINKHSKHYFVTETRPKKDLSNRLDHFVLPVINEEFSGITPVHLIVKSKLKHRCIHKGKCPHRGYDLSQVSVVNGTIKCPLHGLIFDSITKKLIEN